MFDLVASKSGNTHRLVRVGRCTPAEKRELATAAGRAGDPYVAIPGTTTTLIAIPRAES